MKKLLIITLIFLLQSFSSSGSPKGKGIICECIQCSEINVVTDYHHRDILKNQKQGFFFNEETIDVHSFWVIGSKIDYNVTKGIKGNKTNFSSYKSYINHIEWGMWKLDRKTLILTKSNVLGQEVSQCEVFNKPNFHNEILSLLNTYKKILKSIKSKNKI